MTIDLTKRLFRMIDRATALKRAGVNEPELNRAIRAAKAALLNATLPGAGDLMAELDAKADAMLALDPLAALSARRRLAVLPVQKAKPLAPTQDMADAFSALSRALARVEA